ncbi:hypothetical protein RHGRI_014450 [Rhododendron griersonianum]|uniref:Colicin V production protein n=1 Tax=Rhododendron griersonianum TaxID=479676 RepID=A0AAV6K9D0_9ERIC|nr:hypothetical protein RHGRI_014450 [Rhododendron griersonianum]
MVIYYIRLQWWAGDPLSTPLVLIGKAMAGILIAFFLITSALYWTDAYDTQKFSILMTELYDTSWKQVLQGVLRHSLDQF